MIIIKPVITERSLKEAGVNRYTFLVDPAASKTAIKHAVAKQFGVKVVKVLTSMKKGSTLRLTRKGKKQKEYAFKKARVYLQDGQKIDAFEEVVK